MWQQQHWKNQVHTKRHLMHDILYVGICLCLHLLSVFLSIYSFFLSTGVGQCFSEENRKKKQINNTKHNFNNRHYRISQQLCSPLFKVFFSQ